jgi:hypothetical protein
MTYLSDSRTPGTLIVFLPVYTVFFEPIERHIVKGGASDA